MKRKLIAILSADVKGYSRLMSLDEEGTIGRLSAYKQFMADLIRQKGGRVVDDPGDNLLAEFISVVDAVQCAVEIQKEFKVRNAGLPENRGMVFRIGVNLGDVVEKGERIFGEGVNIVARLEKLAEPGGVCLSGIAYDQVKDRLPLEFKSLGLQKIKNMTEPVRVYQVLMEPWDLKKKKGPTIETKNKKAFVLGILAVFLVAVIAVAVWRTTNRSMPPQIEAASKEKMAYPLPDKPSIAVLPFINLSGDPQQEFFSEGITEDIITALSKIRELFVIARGSTFTYKGKAVKVKQVSEELGIRYVLGGSVQRSGDRVRISAQLTDALSGHHLWSERFDRDLEDLFALQDEVTFKILTALQVKLTEGEQGSIFKEKFFRGKQGLESYLKMWEGVHYLLLMSNEGNTKCRQIAEEMVTKWPENPWGYDLLAWTHYMELIYGSNKSPRESLGKALELIQKTLAIDDSNSNAHGLLSQIYCFLREFDKAIAEGERAVALDPNGEWVQFFYANTLRYAGRSKEAIPVYQKAIRLNPLGSCFSSQSLGDAYWATGHLEEAESANKQALRQCPDNLFAHVGQVGIYMEMGREKDARAEAAEVLRINPKFSVDNFARGILAHHKDKGPQSAVVKNMGYLRKAGLK